MSQESTQGIGKVRLIAKNGRASENRATDIYRDLGSQKNNSGKNRDWNTINNRKRKEYAANLLSNGAGLEDYYVEFENTPDITESGSADYFEESKVRGPGSIIVWMGSPSRSFTISAKFISRNTEEAQTNQANIHKLKSWRQPETYTGGFNVASPPAILHLQGYGKMFKDIPVVMTDLSIEFSSEYDYISSGWDYNIYDHIGSNVKVLNRDGTVNANASKLRNLVLDKNQNESNSVANFETNAIPIITSVSITLKEARAVQTNAGGLEGFDILKYRNGDLMGW